MFSPTRSVAILSFAILVAACAPEEDSDAHGQSSAGQSPVQETLKPKTEFWPVASVSSGPGSAGPAVGGRDEGDEGRVYRIDNPDVVRPRGWTAVTTYEADSTDHAATLGNGAQTLRGTFSHE